MIKTLQNENTKKITQPNKTMNTKEIPIIHKRKGFIILNRELLLSSDEVLLSALFSRFYPIQTESYNYWNEIKFFGISPDFDILGEAMITPEYTCLITKKVENETVSYLVEFVKKEDDFG